MALKKLVGLAALGGFLYAHKRRGGTLTMDSFRETARSLFSDVKMRARDLKMQAEQKLEESRTRAGDFGSTTSATGSKPGIGEDVTGYGSAGYGYGSSSSDINRR